MECHLFELNFLFLIVMSVTCGTGTANLSGAPEFTPVVLKFMLLDRFLCNVL